MGNAWITGDLSLMQKRLPLDKEKRRHVIECVILVHNLQTELVGHNQIMEVFALE